MTTAAAITNRATRGHQLAQFLANYPVRPFAWGTHTCVHFAAAWVQACEGVNPLPALDPGMTQCQALRELLRHGPNLAAAVSARLGRQPLAPALAWVGDLVLSPAPLCGQGEAVVGVGQALGLCCGRTAVHLDEHGAAVHLPMSEALQVWRVGGMA